MSQPKQGKSKQTRRSFLKKTGAFVAAGSLPIILPSRVLGRAGQIAPSNRISLGVIGLGLMGGIDLNNFINLPEAQITAICDVDRTRREYYRDQVDAHYADRIERGTYKGCEIHHEFEELIARPDIDAVLNATPDHWHGIIAARTMLAGKDIYSEKPLTRTVDEGKRLVELVRRTGRVFQTGTQARSNAIVRNVVELVRNGRIGKLKRITMALPKYGGLGNPAPETVPEWFDWDRWLGPAPWAPYHHLRSHINFRMFRDYAGGTITDHGVHRMDISLWAANKSHTGPVEIGGEGRFIKNDLSDMVVDFRTLARFEDGLEVSMYDEPDQNKLLVHFEGEEGWIKLPMLAPLPHLPVTASSPSILKSKIRPDEERVYASDNHWQNFLDCVKSRRDPIAAVENGHRATSICLLSEIAMDLERTLQWDPKTERFVNDNDANAMLKRTMREPWSMP